MIIFKQYSFEAAHRLPKVPAGHKCARLHGHSYKVEIYVKSDVLTEGMVMDFAYLDLAWEQLRGHLDHRVLNEIEGLDNPTAEHVAIWIWQRIQLPGVCKIVVWETARSGVIYEGPVK